MNKQHLPASPHWSARCYYAYGALAALFGMNLLNYVDRYVLAAVIKPVQDSFGIGDARGGVLFMAFMLSYALFSPLMGWLGDRMTRKYLLAAVRFLKHRPGQRHRGECHRTGGSGRSFRHQHPADALVGDLPSPVVMGAVSDLTGSLFWGLALTVPTLAIGGLLYCLGAPRLECDEKRAVSE